MNQSVSDSSANTSMVNVIYVLYLLALVSGVTALIGVIVAYVYKDDAPEWLRTHYELQIRTFWMGLLVGAVGVALSWVLIVGSDSWKDSTGPTPTGLPSSRAAVRPAR